MKEDLTAIIAVLSLCLAIYNFACNLGYERERKRLEDENDENQE